MSVRRERIAPSAVRFEFASYGETPSGAGERTDRLLLDVGNALRPGVIDHHHLAAYAGSTTSLALQHPDLVAGAVKPRRRADDPFTIVVHVDPDLDCLAAAYLSVAWLTTGAFPADAEALARYVDEVDQGRLGASQANPFSLYAAYALIAHRLAQRTWRSPRDMWRERLRGGLDLLAFVLDAAAGQGAALPAVDAFECPGLFGASDRQFVREDLDRYRRTLERPATRARILSLRLPGQLGGSAEVDALLVRDIRAGGGEDTLFFKDWARTDAAQSPAGRGFVALCVFHSRAAGDRNRAIISVRPDGGVTLRGLAEALDRAEHEARVRQSGADDRLVDLATGAAKAPRPGYANADPWYDGRAHAYTIVDAPREGSVLSAGEIESVLVRFGRQEESAMAPLRLPSRADCASATLDEGALRLLSLAARFGPAAAREEEGEPAAVFISYPHTRLSWVTRRLYEPVRAWRADLRVFFDRESLTGGALWLPTLASEVARCRVFVPVYCADYFCSDFCQWELQLALTRDPTGRKRVVLPLQLEPVALPDYCSLVQAEDATRPDYPSRFLAVLEAVLGSGS
jgi:hypothetical protein